MKPQEITWNEYLTAIPYDEIVEIPEEYTQLEEALKIERNNIKLVHERCMPYLIESSKPVPDRKYPKQVIKEKTKRFYGSDKFPPYSFRLQCLITGDQSKLIKIADYPSYGILKSDAQNGGEFPDKSDIANKLKIVSDYMNEQIISIRNRMNEIYSMLNDASIQIQLECQDVWFERYNEYLYSDEWKKIRNEIVEMDKQCLNCDSKQRLHVHHITYENVGKEQRHDLLTLCSDCHEKVHTVEYNKRIEIEENCIAQRQFNKI